MFDETSVTSLVVAGMEAILKDGRLDVASFLAFVPGNRFRLASDFAPFYSSIVKIAV